MSCQKQTCRFFKNILTYRLFHLPIPLHEGHERAFGQHIPILITEVIGIAGSRCIAMRMVLKIVSFHHQFIPWHTGFTMGIEFFKNAAVAAQNSIDAAHKIIRITVLPVVVIVAALV